MVCGNSCHKTAETVFASGIFSTINKIGPFDFCATCLLLESESFADNCFGKTVRIIPHLCFASTRINSLPLKTIGFFLLLARPPSRRLKA